MSRSRDKEVELDNLATIEDKFISDDPRLNSELRFFKPHPDERKKTLLQQLVQKLLGRRYPPAELTYTK